MGALGAVQFAVDLVQGLSILADAGQNVAGKYKEGLKILQDLHAEKRDPTAAEWERLNLEVIAMQKELQSENPDEVAQKAAQAAAQEEADKAAASKSKSKK